jgi:hypothetical protein
MRSILVSISVLGAAALLTGCSDGPGSNGAPVGPAQTYSRSLADLARTGVSPAFLTVLQFRRSVGRAQRAQIFKGPKDLYVTDRDLGDVVIFANKTYREVGTITNGTFNGDGDYIDKRGNLYVADTSGDIEEYAAGATSPTFTYTAGMSDPINVSVDRKGRVYEADYEGKVVNEYAQESNSVVESCAPGGGAEGIAVDTSGDVFVAYNGSSGGKIAEYKGGLSGCSESVLTPSFKFVGGMVMDGKGDLVVCDQQSGVVDVIDPPYSSISGTLGSGFGTPLHVTLNKQNTLAFVTDIYDLDVDVLDYPSGKPVATLSGANGLEDPWGAVDAPNAVY